RITCDGELVVEDSLDADGRRRICEAVGAFAMGLAESPLVGHPERLPLRLVGDGETARYQDRPVGYGTMHGGSSVAGLGQVLGTELIEVRFRSNVSMDGLEPFEEQGWMGRHVRIGSARFRVELPIRRCLAPHANPETGERDQPILRSEEHTSELQSRENLVCRLLLEKKKSPWSL